MHHLLARRSAQVRRIERLQCRFGFGQQVHSFIDPGEQDARVGALRIARDKVMQYQLSAARLREQQQCPRELNLQVIVG